MMFVSLKPKADRTMTQDEFVKKSREELKKYVKGRGGYVVLSNGKMLDVSVRKKDDFFDKFDK